MYGPHTPVCCVCLRSVLNYSKGKSRKPFPFIWVTNYKLLGWWRVSIGGRLRAKATLSACFRNYEGWVGQNFLTIVPLSRRNCLITSSFGKLSIQNQLLSIYVWTKYHMQILSWITYCKLIILFRNQGILFTLGKKTNSSLSNNQKRYLNSERTEKKNQNRSGKNTISTICSDETKQALPDFMKFYCHYMTNWSHK